MNLFRVEKDKPKIWIHLVSEFTVNLVGLLKEELLKAIEAGFINISMDFANISIIEPRGIGLLVMIKNSLPEEGSLEVINLSSEFIDMFYVFGLNEHFIVKGA